MTEGKATRESGFGFHIPFLVGDGLLLLAAWVVFAQANRPMLSYEVLAIGACVAAGCALGVWPWVLRQRAEIKRLETSELADAIARIGQVEDIARHITLATGKWHTAQDAAERTVRAARDLADRMGAEQAGFREFLEKAQETERQHLQVEVEKLRRSEGVWMQTLVFLLDHTYALFLAATRSGQENVIHQIGRFQSACLDAVRRVGLTSLVVPQGTPFDPDSHQIPEEAQSTAPGTAIAETLAPGYHFQGSLLRKPLVRLDEGLTAVLPSADSDTAPDSAFECFTSNPASEAPPAHTPDPDPRDPDAPASPS